MSKLIRSYASAGDLPTTDNGAVGSVAGVLYARLAGVWAALTYAAASITGQVAVANGGTGAANAATARTNLGVAYGTTAGTVAEGNDSRIVGAAQKSANLSDLANAGAARTNLGLAAVAASGAYSDLTGTPALAAVATSGDYDDLINTPPPATDRLIAACTVVGSTGAYANAKGITSVTRNVAGEYTIVLSANAATSYFPLITSMLAVDATGKTLGVTKTTATEWVVTTRINASQDDVDFSFSLWNAD